MVWKKRKETTENMGRKESRCLERRTITSMTLAHRGKGRFLAILLRIPISCWIGGVIKNNDANNRLDGFLQWIVKLVRGSLFQVTKCLPNTWINGFSGGISKYWMSIFLFRFSIAGSWENVETPLKRIGINCVRLVWQRCHLLMLFNIFLLLPSHLLTVHALSHFPKSTSQSQLGDL